MDNWAKEKIANHKQKHISSTQISKKSLLSSDFDKRVNKIKF
jgi:hypothetical protein